MYDEWQANEILVSLLTKENQSIALTFPSLLFTLYFSLFTFHSLLFTLYFSLFTFLFSLFPLPNFINKIYRLRN